MVHLSPKFRVSRAADSHGPVELLVLYVGETAIRGVYFIRNRDEVVIEKVFTCDGLTQDQVARGGLDLKKICSDEELSITYCSVVLTHDSEQLHVVNLPANTDMSPQAVCNFIGESQGRSDGYAIGYQFISGEDENNKSVIGSTIPLKVVDAVEKSASDAGVTLVRLEVEAVPLLNYMALDSLDTQEVVSYLYVGENTSKLFVALKGHLIFSREFGMGLESIIQDMCDDKSVPENVMRQFFDPKNDLDFTTRLSRSTVSWMQQLARNIDFVENTSGATIQQIRCIGLGVESFVIQKRVKQETRRMVVVDKYVTQLKNFIETEGYYDINEFFVPVLSGLSVMCPKFPVEFGLNFAPFIDWKKESQIKPSFYAGVVGVAVVLVLAISYFSMLGEVSALEERVDSQKAAIKSLVDDNKELVVKRDVSKAVNKDVVAVVESRGGAGLVWSSALEKVTLLTPDAIALNFVKISGGKVLQISGWVYKSPQDAESVVESFIGDLKSKDGFGSTLDKIELSSITNTANNDGGIQFSISCIFESKGE